MTCQTSDLPVANDSLLSTGVAKMRTCKLPVNYKVFVKQELINFLSLQSAAGASIMAGFDQSLSFIKTVLISTKHAGMPSHRQLINYHRNITQTHTHTCI